MSKIRITDPRFHYFRRPAGDAYRDAVVLRARETVAPLAAPTAAIPVADQLP